MTHDELAADLAKHLLATGDVCVWTDMQMGPVGSPRPDVYILPKKYGTFHPVSYEVKVSIADFRADTTRAKWQSYLPFSAGVVFACPAGLLKPADVPTGCGLIERNATGWRHSRRPTLRHVENLPIKVWQKLVIDGVDRAHMASRKRLANEWHLHEAIKRKLGDRVGKIIADQDEAERALKWQRDNVDRERDRLAEQLAGARDKFERDMRESVDPQLAKLAEALGIEAFDPRQLYVLINRIHTAKAELAESAALAKLDQHLVALQHRLSIARDELSAVRPRPAADPSAPVGLDTL